MEDFFVSVVIPAFNAEKTIEKTLLGLYKQTLLPYEIIVINDASTDKTEEIVKNIAEQAENPKIKLFNYAVNEGIAVARNKGVSKATGNYIAFCSADDVWLPNKLEIQKSFVEINPNSIQYSDVYFINENDDVVYNYRAKDFDSMEDFRIACWKHATQNDMFVNFSTVLIPKNLWFDCWEAITIGEDLCWLLESALIKRYVFVHVPFPLAFYRMHKERETDRKFQYIPANNELIRDRIWKMLEESKK